MTKGIRIYNEAGATRLSSDGTFLRYFGGHTIPANFSGTFTMTGFDDASGFFVPAFRLGKTNNSEQVLADDTYWTANNDYASPGVLSGANVFEFPDLVFSSPTMTVTDNAVPAPFDGDNKYDQEVFLGFYYYKGGRSTVSGSKSIEIRNQDGNLQISFERALYAKRTGTTSLIQASGTLPDRGLITAGDGLYQGLTGLVPLQRPLQFRSFDTLAQTPNGTWAAESVGSTSILTPEHYDDKTDLVFFRLTQPLVYQATFYHEYPDLAETGAFTVISTRNDAAMDYCVCSTTPPAGAPAGTKALQLRLDDASNTVNYDSRYPTMKIVLEVGETKQVRIPAEEAYGPYRDEMILELPREQLPGDVELEIGQQVQMQQGEHIFVVRVEKIGDEAITFNANHPLAGEALNFDLRLVEIQ